MAAPANTPAKRKKASTTAKPDEMAVPTADTSAREATVDIERIVTMSQETMKQAAADYSAKATEMFQSMSEKAKAAFEKSGDMSKEAVEFHKANLEAVVESGKLAAKSLQDVAQHQAEVGKQRWEAASAHAKSLASMTSPTDLMAAQSEFLRHQFDSVVADFSKSTEFFMKLAGEIVQPVQNRYAAAAEQVKTRFAA